MRSTNDAPAAAVVLEDNFARFSRNAMRKGARCNSLIAFNALFEVSLRLSVLFSLQQRGKTHERHHRIVITFSARLKTSSVVFSGAEVGEVTSLSRADDI